MADLDKTIKKLEEYETKIAMFHKVIASCSSAYVRVNEETIHSVLELLKEQVGLKDALKNSNTIIVGLNNVISDIGETINILKDENNRLKGIIKENTR